MDEENEVKEYRPKDTPGLIPYIIVRDINESLRFYREAFNFQLARKPVKVEDNIVHAVLEYLDMHITLAPEGAWGMPKRSPATTNLQSPIALYVYVEDVDAFFTHAIMNGATTITEPTDMFWGDRICNLKDIDGYDWSFGTIIENFDPKKVPLPE